MPTATNTLTVLEQQVSLSDDTTVDATLTDTVFSDVAALGPIRVSGIADGFGKIAATYIAREPAQPFRLTGFATAVDEINLSFLVGPQAISYANAMVVELATTAPLNNGRVVITGDKEATVFTVDTIIDAPLVPSDLENDARIQLTAAVTLPLTDGSFGAGFVLATPIANATFTNGSESDLVPGAIVTVQGLWSDAQQRIEVTAIHVVRAP